MSRRSPRFDRAPGGIPFEIIDRDRKIIHLVHRHRFLRSNQIISLLGGSRQQILRRLQLLFQHGYLERPRAQIQYYERGGSKSIAYGLGNKGGALLRQAVSLDVNPYIWSEKNNAVGRVYLEHALLISEVMVSLELSCQKHGLRLLYEDELGLPVGRQPFGWQVKIQGGTKLGVIPDKVFSIEYKDQNSEMQRAYFFLEADRGTMPIVRKGLGQTSIYRKLLGYESTWTNKVHLRYLGIPRFRVLIVTTVPDRVTSMFAACRQLKRGHGLFLFADQSVLTHDLFSPVWRNGKTGELSPLIDLPDRQVPPPPAASPNP